MPEFETLIASFKHGFIFIKTRKTAGSSIEFALGPHCGPTDIIAPIGPSEDRDRARLTGVVPMNFARDTAYEARYVAAVKQGNRKQIRDLLAGLPEHGGIEPHEPAAGIRAYVPRNFWDRALKFTVERHPYEKAVSLAWFRYQAGGDFSSHLDRVIQTMADEYRGFHLYSIDQSPVVDVVIRYDTLQADLDALCKKLGLPALGLPSRRSHTRKDRQPARDILTADQKKIVAAACSREFELFGWQS